MTKKSSVVDKYIHSLFDTDVMQESMGDFLSEEIKMFIIGLFFGALFTGVIMGMIWLL